MWLKYVKMLFLEVKIVCRGQTVENSESQNEESIFSNIEIFKRESRNVHCFIEDSLDNLSSS